MFKTSRKTDIPSNVIPHWPYKCACGKATVLAVLAVYDNRGQIHHGAASDFLTPQHDHAQRTLREPYTFARWDAYCENHAPGEPNHAQPGNQP